MPGVGTSFWTSDVILTNPTPEDIVATLTFTRRNRNGLDNYQVGSVTVPAGGCRIVAKVGAPMDLIEGQVLVEVTGGGGRISAVLSLVDELSDDPTTLVLQPRWVRASLACKPSKPLDSQRAWCGGDDVSR